MKRLIMKVLTVGCVTLGVILLLGSGLIFVAARRSVIPDNINMSSGGMAGMEMSGMDMSSMGAPSADATPITALVAPQSDAPVKSFTLTAQMASLDLGNGKPIDAYTYNGVVPGPELRVQQGDMVVVTLVNKLPVSTTIHWHGVNVPNAEDGVAGLTQDAVKPGQTYTYKFIVNDVGTYWYHSHQDTSVQLPAGMYGTIIVEPKDSAIHYDHDYSVFLHEWNAPSHDGLQGLTTCHATCPETLSMNNRMDKVSFDAKPGEIVRLRIANSGEDMHNPVLVGAPFEVIALDGHDLNSPTPLKNVALRIGPAQRYDISFVMPASGPVALIDDVDRAEPADQHPMAVFGNDGTDTTTLIYPANPTQFDFSSYGTPATDKITLNSHFDVNDDMLLGTQPGMFDGNMTLTFPINKMTYPNIPSINVKMGDLVKIHMTNNGMFPIPHAMHLHGHYFTVLAHNGKALTGSPVHLDTIYIEQGETYDVAFLADNPGLWMLHCHMVEHDAHGMDMMVNYPNIYTPFTVGKTSGNNPF